jgi:hypothetical protein
MCSNIHSILVKTAMAAIKTAITERMMCHRSASMCSMKFISELGSLLLLFRKFFKRLIARKGRLKGGNLLKG